MKKTNKITAIIMAFLMAAMMTVTSVDCVNAASKSTGTKISTTVKRKELTKKQALSILKKKEKNIEFIYMGTEKDFDAISNKKMKGYVFLPDIEGDIGYFVNSKNSKIYYFHPSGYMKLMK